MLKRIQKILAPLFIVAITLLQASPALAARVLIYSNEVFEENGNLFILDADDTGGDIVLQFGGTLNERFYWDDTDNIFRLTDDFEIDGDLGVTGNMRAGTGSVTGYVELLANQSGSGFNLTISNSGLTADLVLTADNLQKLADITSTASQIDTAVSDSHVQNTDTGTTNNSFRVDSDASNGYVELVGNLSTGNFDLTITNSGISADLTVTAADLKKLYDITATAAEIDDAVAKRHDQNTDTGTDNDSFTINNDGTNATLQFGSGTDGQIVFDDAAQTFNFDSNRLTGVLTPNDSSDAANKGYVDNLINGLSWRSPIEHPNQLVDGVSGGIRSGGKVFVSDYTQVNNGDTIVVTHSGSSAFTLTAAAVPVPSSCQFKSSASAVSNTDMATSLLTAIDNCAAAADFSGQSTTHTDSLYLIFDTPTSNGDGTVVPSGSGFITIDMHDGESYSEISSAETRVTRYDEIVNLWDGDTNTWIEVSGASSIPDATTTTKGKVELATDGETAAGVVVQGNDSRLHDQNTDTGTTNNSFRVDSDASNGYVELVGNLSTGNFDLTITNSGISADLTVTAADLKKLVDIASTASQIDNAVSEAHAQNTDTNTNSTSFLVGTGAAAGSVSLLSNQATGNFDLIVSNSGLTADLTITGEDLQKLADLTVTAAQLNTAVAESHVQGTDTGSTAETFTLDTDNTGGNITLSFGTSLGETLTWNSGSDIFVFSDDLQVEGGLDVNGTITAGSSNLQLTDATGNIDGEYIQNDSIDDNALDFGTGTDQIAASDIPVVDEFAYSDSTNTQDVLDDFDDELGTLASSSHQQNTDIYTTSMSYIVGSGATAGYIDIVADEATGNFNLTLTNSGISADLTVTAADLKKLVDITSTAAQIDTAVANSHVQNTDTGTISTSFRVDSDASNGYVELIGDQATGNFDLVISNSGLTADLTVDATDLQKLADLTSTASQIDTAVADSHVQGTDTGSTATTFTLDTGGAGGDISLSFGPSLVETLSWDSGSGMFIFSDDLEVSGDLDVTGFLSLASGTAVNAILDEDNMASDSDSALATQQSIKAYVDSSTTDISWSALVPRTKVLPITMNDMTVLEDGTDNRANIYTESSTGSNPHEYYLVQTRRSTLQDLDVKIKFKLPEDFVEFATGTDNISFFYKNTGVNNTDSKIDILVQDDDGDNAFTASSGADLFSASWTEFAVEFDGPSFNPVAGEYIFITIKGYASRDGIDQMPYIGEIYFTYKGR